MARRSGQSGSIQKEGNWYVIRYWKDVAGEEKRQRVYAKICPISGPGKLSASERKRKAKEIIAASGVDTQEYFDKVVKQSAPGVTFRQQAETWLEGMGNRKRKPLAPSTIAGWSCGLDIWINPNIGDLPLASFNNAAMKKLVGKMDEGGLSPKSISNNVQIVKMVVASAVNEQGDELYPRKWNNEFIDMPVVNNQRQPSFTGDVVTAIIRETEEQKYRVLFALCASSGLRFGEALGIDIKNISPDGSNIKIVGKAWRSERHNFLKTGNGKLTCILRWRPCCGNTWKSGRTKSGRARLTCCLPHVTASRSTSRISCGACCTRSWKSWGSQSAASVRSGVFATRTCGTSRPLRQESTSSGWDTRARRLKPMAPCARAKPCQIGTTRWQLSVDSAKNGQKEQDSVSRFRPKSSLLDGMDGNPKMLRWKQ
jgi:hypothetical protein